MDIAIKAAQLVLALVLLVVVHEFGHYSFARLFGVKVNRFYLFFNPWFSLLKYNPMAGTLEILSYNGKDGSERCVKRWQVGRKHTPDPTRRPTWRDTVYGLGWLPLGGYCDIAGMIDETKSADDIEAENLPEAWQFRFKPAWQRLIVMVAGVVLNFVLAVVIYTGIAFHWGDKVIPFTAMTEGMDFAPELIDAGFRNGDILLSLDGKPMDPKDYSIAWDMIQPGARVGVRRGQDTVTVTVSDALVRNILGKGKDYMPMSMRVPVVVAKTMNGDPAEQAGIAPGDRILRVGCDTTPAISEFMPVLAANKGRTLPFLIKRADGSSATVDVAISDSGKIGIQMLSPTEIFNVEQVHYSLFRSVPRGWEIGTDRLTSYVSSLSLIFTREGAQSLGGFGTLGDLFPSSWNWYSFWQITAFLSIILAFMNIIPIPGLDGGHTLFLIAEVITRRKPSERFLEIANTAGFFFLIALLLYANANDIYRFIIK